jgi:nicotinamidase-related amidase
MPHPPELPIPAHFDPDRAGEVWRVPYEQRAAEARAWRQRHRLKPAAADAFRVGLLLVDCQNSFCIPGFELFVAGRSGRGAVDDNIRLCRFLYRNLGAITEIMPTLDTHTATQIFHSVFFIDEAGEPPPPYTTISVTDVERGRWKVNPAAAASIPGEDENSLQEHLLHYARQLRAGGKYQLMVWPYHALLGGIGHALVSAVEETVFFHTLARQSQPGFEVKGSNPLVENYSALAPEVLTGAGGRPIAAPNVRLIEKLFAFDMILIAGQAKSHCVAWTVEDLLAEMALRNPELARKVFLLEDCTSPVVVPGRIDFTDQADAAFERFARAGVHRVRSTEPMASWPGVWS